MISPAAAELIRRGREQIRAGIAHVQSGEPLIAEVWLRAGVASMDALEAHLNAPDHKPLRKMALVAVQKPGGEEEPLPQWATKKHGEPEGAA